MNKKDLVLLNQVLDMMDIDDYDMNLIAEEFMSKSKGNDIYGLAALQIKNIINSFNMLAEIKWVNREDN